MDKVKEFKRYITVDNKERFKNLCMNEAYRNTINNLPKTFVRSVCERIQKENNMSLENLEYYKKTINKNPHSVELLTKINKTTRRIFEGVNKVNEIRKADPDNLKSDIDKSINYLSRELDTLRNELIQDCLNNVIDDNKVQMITTLDKLNKDDIKNLRKECFVNGRSIENFCEEQQSRVPFGQER